MFRCLFGSRHFSETDLTATPRRQALVGIELLGTYVRVQMGQQSYCTETASEHSSWIPGGHRAAWQLAMARLIKVVPAVLVQSLNGEMCTA